jgi:hypothetical protein
VVVDWHLFARAAGDPTRQDFRKQADFLISMLVTMCRIAEKRVA